MRTVVVLAGWVAALGLVSAAWSIDPRLTFGRAVSFAILLFTAGSLAVAARARPGLPVRLLLGVLGGTAAACLAGLVLLAVDYGAAVQPPSDVQPPRFEGIGENPDTISMLSGIVSPIALWGLLRARTWVARVVFLGSLLLLLGSITASGSRGGLLATLAGGVVFSVFLPVRFKARLLLGAAVVATVFSATAITRIPKPLPTERNSQQPVASSGGQSHGGQSGVSTPPPTPGGIEQAYQGRLQDELYRFNGTRTLFTSSGRLQAWATAIQEADARPLLGYGFGTEDRAFIERVYGFQGSYVESSIIGFYLQLGAVGLASLTALLVAVFACALLAVRRARDATSALLMAVFGAGVAVSLVQSYLYSVGNVATVAFWVVGFLAAAMAATSARVPATVTELEPGGAVASA